MHRKEGHCDERLSLGVELTERQRRMVEDTDVEDVTPAEVKSLLLRLKHLNKPDLNRKMRIKYDEFITDKQKLVMTRLGVDYDNHIITVHQRSCTRQLQMKMLYLARF